MKKRFYQKTSFIVLDIIGIIIMIACLILRMSNHVSILIFNLVIVPIGLTYIAIYIYMIRCMIQDKKLRDLVRHEEIKISIEPPPGVLTAPENAIININGNKYLIETPFRKEGAYPEKGDTLYSYLSSKRLIKSISKKLIKWLEKDMQLPDTAMTEYNLCYFFRDLVVVDSNNPLFLCSTRTGEMDLIIAIENLAINKTPRGLEHIIALIKAASAHERKYYAGQFLLDAFDYCKNGEMTTKIFMSGDYIGYCFLRKNS